jgi:hypothetical protein
MRKHFIVALCLITLCAVCLDVFLLHQPTVRAANGVRIQVSKIESSRQLLSGQVVVGFSCTSSGALAECFIATSESTAPLAPTQP